jgi:hypothetical protein
VRLRRVPEATMEERFLGGGAVHPEAERREHTFLRMLGRGLLRLAGLLFAAAAITAGLGLLIGWLRGDDLWTAVAYAFYIGGIAVFGFALLSGGRRVHYRGDLGEDLGTGGGAINEGALMILVAFFLLGLGVLVESQT